MERPAIVALVSTLVAATLAVALTATLVLLKTRAAMTPPGPVCPAGPAGPLGPAGPVGPPGPAGLPHAMTPAARMRLLMTQDRLAPTAWTTVGVVTGDNRAFTLMRRRDRARRRWQYRVEDRYGVRLNLDRDKYRELLADHSMVLVPGYGDMRVALDEDLAGFWIDPDL